jgi:hypothetical protein
MSKRISKMLFSKERVELALIDDVESQFDKVTNAVIGIDTTLIKNLQKAKSNYNEIVKGYEEVIKLGEKVEQASKDLGIDIPNVVKNRIADSKEKSKLNQKLISKISELISAL